MIATQYSVTNLAKLFSPSLLFFEELIEANLKRVVEIAGSSDRLRPHVKTHKCPEIVQKALQQGITKHKCATIAEAEMLAIEKVPDVLISYPLVGPNLQRLTALIQKYPATSFAILVDHPTSLKMLEQALCEAGVKVRVLLDLDVGQHRTGICVEKAGDLYRQLASTKNVIPDGFQLYDGHNNQPELESRKKGVEAFLEPILQLRSLLEKQGIPVPRLVCGGTPSFPVHASLNIPGVECSPGTFVLHDAGYGEKYEDLRGFQPAAVVLTRVVSKPTKDRVTFDVGTKAIASDPPAGKRLKLIGFDNFEPVGHNEEHFIIQTPEADRFQPGDWMYAVPIHICPTVALHATAYVVKGQKVGEQWKITARDRVLTI
ncbi:D-TA family PLP-dependent enzyme [Telmatocola sphagniphila]|uniref:D-TA family PLP-dependent enzyme n=1 Tax=Telmatocola sphagniphila TaxID=1123043 RepID=UPI001FEC86A2|nr:D-TA family PLP-dependent enzyme [Telmatocola sphagniphila]